MLRKFSETQKRVMREKKKKDKLTCCDDNMMFLKSNNYIINEIGQMHKPFVLYREFWHKMILSTNFTYIMVTSARDSLNLTLR